MRDFSAERIKKNLKKPLFPQLQSLYIIMSEQKKSLWTLARRLLIIFLVVSLGLFAVNQFLQYRYKAEFLKAPCKLCAELNPEVKDCLVYKRALYPDGFGGWSENPGEENISFNYTEYWQDNINPLD